MIKIWREVTGKCFTLTDAKIIVRKCKLNANGKNIKVEVLSHYLTSLVDHKNAILTIAHRFISPINHLYWDNFAKNTDTKF